MQLLDYSFLLRYYLFFWKQEQNVLVSSYLEMFVHLWFEYSKAFAKHGAETFDTSFTRLHGMFLKVRFFLLSVLTCSFIIWTRGWFLNFWIAISTGLPKFVVSPNIRFFGQIFRDLTAFLKAVAQKCSVKKLFLENSQKSRENTCARVSFLLKLQA